MKDIILYGAGPVAEKLCRYIRRTWSENRVVCFAVTDTQGQKTFLDNTRVCSVEEALNQFPEAEIWVAAQEKHHAGIASVLNTLNRTSARTFGLQEVSELLKQECIGQIRESCGSIAVEEDEKDYSMLSIYTEGGKNLFKLFPMTAAPLGAAELEYLHSGRLSCDFMRLYGAYPAAPQVDQAGSLGEKRLFVGAVSSGRDQPLQSELETGPWLKRIFCGAAALDKGKKAELKRTLGSAVFFDDEGENISPDNSNCSELTATYWLWKNVADYDYLGVCHYRRRFVLDSRIRSLIDSGEVDVILPTPRLTFPPVREFFLDRSMTSMSDLDLELMLRGIEQLGGGWMDCAQKLLGAYFHFPNNMVIAKREVFSDYCCWLFSILLDIDAYYKGQGIIRHDRYLGYIGEILTSLFFAYYHDKYKMAFCEYRLLK